MGHTYQRTSIDWKTEFDRALCVYRQPPSVPCDRGRRPRAIQRGLQPPLTPPPQETLRDPQVGQARCARGPGAPCASGLSVSPSSVQLLCSSPAGVTAKCSGAPPPDTRPRAGEPDVGLGALTPVGAPLRRNYSPVCRSPCPGVWDLVISLVHPSRRLTGFLPYVLGCGVSFWVDPVFFTDVVQRSVVILVCS